MLQPDVVARLRLLVDTARAPAAADTTRVNEVSPLSPGQRVTARVEREIADARFHVIVRGKTYEMKLPAGVRTGQMLELSYLSDTPRPTFLLANTAQGAQGNELSQLGKFIAALLGPKQQTSDGAKLQRAQAPPLTRSPTETTMTPALLRAALAESGIFYESHQAQWVAGRLPLEQLRREPQGKLAPLETPQPPPEPAGKNTTQPASAPPGAAAASRAEQVPVADLRTGPVNNQLNAGNLAQPNPIHPETAPIVRQQLETLDTRHVIWQGEAWPGQWMEWETGEEPQSSSEGTQPAWYSTLSLELPVLGIVRIRTVLAGSGARVRVEFGDGAAGEKLRAAQPLLAANLQSRGIDLADFRVVPRATGADNATRSESTPNGKQKR